MTKKLTDLEGRLDAAYDRAYKPKTDKIGAYRMIDRNGMVPAEIIFCKLTTTETVEWVVWDRRIENGAKYRGDYFNTFREALHCFLKRIEADGAHAL